MYLIPALWGQSQEDFCEFEDSMVYRTNSRTCTRNTLSQKTEQKKRIKLGMKSNGRVCG